jgi:flagellar biosynthesis protein FlhG
MMAGDQATKLREMVSRIQQQEKTAENSGSQCKVYCVTSGKGGVGKTSFTVNFAIALSRCGKKVVILDADFGFSNVNIMLGTNSKYNMSHVLNGEKKLNEIMEECFPNVWHISGGAGMSDLVQVDEEKLDTAMKQLTEIERFADYIMIDTGAGMNRNILRMMEASDVTILVMTSEPTSIVDSYVVLKTAALLERKPEILTLINKAGSAKDAINTFESFSNVVSKHLMYHVEMMGYLPVDNRVTESISSLAPHIMKYPSSLLSVKLQSMAGSVTNTAGMGENRNGFKGFFSRFFGKGEEMQV